MKQTVRIIGGKYRGKKLNFPDMDGLRPTPDRVRETLFNWLMQTIHGARCLDAFAGSGALGFEAYSRGAKRVVFLESSWQAYQHLLQQAAFFNTSSLMVLNREAMDFLSKTSECFDIVFLDPPFAKNYLPECMQRLASSAILPPGGLVYCESPRQLAVDLVSWQPCKLKKAGQVVYGLYEKRSS